MGDFPDWTLSKEQFRVVRVNAFEISWLVTGLVTVDGNDGGGSPFPGIGESSGEGHSDRYGGSTRRF